MSNTSSQVKDRYNSKKYKTYTFRVANGSELHQLLENVDRTNEKGNSFNSFVCDVLLKHFNKK